jgi:hypothetical protein
VAVATATLVAAGGADLHRASGHHHHRAHAAGAATGAAPAASATQTQAAPSASMAPRPVVAERHTSTRATSATKQQRKQRTAKTEQSIGTAPPAPGTLLPATQGGDGTFADTPPSPSTADAQAGEVDPPTDPADQSIGAKEPVETQGFSEQGPQDTGSPASP